MMKKRIIEIAVKMLVAALTAFLTQCPDVLKSGGRLVVMSYHSLEDRIVKNFMKTGNAEGKEEKDFYGNLLTPYHIITRKPIVPSDEEMESNRKRCGAYHRQLAEWLEDYKRLLEQMELEDGDRVVSLNAVLEKAGYTETEEGWCGYTVDVDYIKSLPPVYPQEPKTGYWKSTIDGKPICSGCGFISESEDWYFVSRYCPNCGRKMFKTGHWIFYGRLLKCSNCGYINDDILDECPNCKISMFEPQERSDKE